LLNIDKKNSVFPDLLKFTENAAIVDEEIGTCEDVKEIYPKGACILVDLLLI
jgi:hypothetical protein